MPYGPERPVNLDGIRTEHLATWSSEHMLWTARSLSVVRIVDTRFVVSMSGKAPHTGMKAYDSREDAARIVRQLMATPNAKGDITEWHRTDRSGNPV